jgi:hypothetical protein
MILCKDCRFWEHDEDSVPIELADHGWCSGPGIVHFDNLAHDRPAPENLLVHDSDQVPRTGALFGCVHGTAR